MNATARQRLQFCRLIDHPAPAWASNGAEAIFFATATVQEFASAAARSDFRERWFGRYLTQCRDYVWLAQHDAILVGYLLGFPGDPSHANVFAADADPAAFVAAYSKFPAHLHMNIDPAFQGQGIGTQLVEQFIEQLIASRVIGVHVVTAAAARNAQFYRRNQFTPVATASLGNRDLVMLGRALPVDGSKTALLAV